MRLLNRLSWIACAAILSAPQVIPIDGAPPGPRTGAIAGQVVDTTGAAVADALVRLALPKYSPALPTTPNGRVMADRDGRFPFENLPAGDYYLQATKDGYADGMFGQRQPFGQNLLVPLVEGDRRTDVTLTLWKYAVIAGTVVDEAGEPVVGVGVRALATNVIGGRQRFGNLEVRSDLVPTAVTDDRGMFRLSQLLPGTYVVVVPSTQTTMPIAALDAYAQDSTLRGDLYFGGIVEVAPLGQPRILQAGGFAMLTLSRVLIPPPPASDGRMQVYPPTFYPAAATPAEAARMTLESGEERTDIAIALRPVPAVRVSGRLVTPDGSPPPQTTIALVGDGMASVVDSGTIGGPDPVTARFETATGMSDASGRFLLLGVPPGDYVLKQANRFLSRAIAQGLPSYWLSQRIWSARAIADPSPSCVPRFASKAGSRISRRGPADSRRCPPADSRIAFETPFGGTGQFFVEVPRGTSTFATVAAGGHIARPVEIRGWFVQSITVGDKGHHGSRVRPPGRHNIDRRDLYGPAFESVGAREGRARRRESHRAMVLAFPVDQERWTGYGSSPRVLKSALTTRAGVYVRQPASRRTTSWRSTARRPAMERSENARSAGGPGDEIDRERRWPRAEDSRPHAEGDSMNGRPLAVVAFAIVCGAATGAQQPATARQAPPIASIAGRVFVAGAGEAAGAALARVTLTNVAHSSPGQTATTDDAGAFTFRGVPAGRFEMQAFKNGYLRANYGAARPESLGHADRRERMVRPSPICRCRSRAAASSPEPSATCAAVRCRA